MARPGISPTSAVALGGLALTFLAATSTVSAHPDDPKVRDKMPAYQGPGWTEASDSIGPDFQTQSMVLRSWLSVDDFGSGAYAGNDCWGWTSPEGREYALMGLSNATGIVDITNPGQPAIRGVIGGPSSDWRDVKTYEGRAYVVTEGFGVGIQVIDLRPMASGFPPQLINEINTGAPGSDTSTHNVAIDEVSGYLYRCGGTYDGVQIYSLADPDAPALVGNWPNMYVHDLQVVTYDSGPFAGRELAFLCGGLSNGFVDPRVTILDVTDKSNPVILDESFYPQSAYSHQAWLNEDRTKLYMNDEVDEGNFGLTTRIHVFDVSDPTSIVYDGSFTNGNSAIGHNLYIKGDLLYSANYRSGVRIFDLAQDPLNPPEVAWIDTFPGSDSPNFNGAWNVFPFFDSGTIIISDIQRGLIVTEIDTPPVAIEFLAGAPDGRIDPSGEPVRILATEVETGALDGAEARLNLQVDGVVTEVPMSDLGGGVFDALTAVVDCPASVSWWIDLETAGGEIVSLPTLGAEQPFEAIAVDDLEVRFADDAETNPGWTVENTDLTDGQWDRGVPAGVGDRGDPTADADGSGRAWLTDNVAGNSDVDGGPTRLTSPTVDLDGTESVQLSYARWITSTNGALDSMVVELSDDDGATWTTVETATPAAGWTLRKVRVEDFVELTGTVRVRFSATDNPNDSVTEAGVDAVRFEVLACDDAVLGDVDGDGEVGFEDLLIVLASFGDCKTVPCDADVDLNGVVDFQDLLLVLANWT